MTRPHTPRNSEAHGEAEQVSNIPELRFLQAWALVKRGALDEAENLLCNDGATPTRVVELDLLARIWANRGRFDLAERLWKIVLQKDPNHDPAKLALERLAKPWLGVGLAKRIGHLAGVAVLVFLSAVGLFALLCGSQYLSQKGIAQRTILKVVSKPVAQIPETRTILGSVQAEQSRQEASSTKNEAVRVMLPTIHAVPTLTVPDCSVFTNRNETRIVFNDGLFTYFCELKETANERIATLARALKDKTSNVWIVIEGHTDSDPLKSNRFYRDNYSLGLSRAKTIAEILSSQYQIPASSLLITSLGETTPPFVGEDRKSKLRNRTVVIRLIPIAAGARLRDGNTEELGSND